jgi:predicted amidohydrolase YtcJ
MTVTGMTSPVRVGEADLLLFNGKIITVNSSFSIAQAVAVRDGRIIAVGSNKEVERYAGPATRRINLRHQIVTPGFIDGHPHLFGIEEIPLTEVKSVKDILAVVSDAVAKRRPGEWLVLEPPGEPPYYLHMPESLLEKRYPTRQELDQAAPQNPVYIKSSPFHQRPTAIFNRLALESLGITRESGPIKGVEVIRESDGTPTGQIVGNLSYFSRSPLRDRLWAVSSKPDFEHQLAELKRDMRRFNAGGVTAIYEGHGLPETTIALYNELWNRGEMTVRAYLVKTIKAANPMETINADLDNMAAFRGAGFGDDFLKVGGICIEFGDNVGFGAGFMREPYVGAEGRKWQGLQLISEEHLYEIARAATDRKIRVNVQASGGRAIDITLSVLDRINRETPITDRRFVLEHCQFPSEQNMKDVVRLGIIPTTVTNFLWGQGDAYVRFYGGELANQAIPLKSWLAHGVPVALSTDYGPHEAMFTLWQAIARKNGWTGERLGPQESISREEAIRIYTINGARLAFWEHELGSLETGKLADLVILDRDILTCPLDDIRTTKVIATLVGGKLVYGSLENLQQQPER